MEDNEEEDFDDHFSGNTGFSAFDDDIPMETPKADVVEDDPMEEPKADVAEDDPSDDLGQALRNVRADCESEKKRTKFQKMLEDHRKLLYQRLRRWIEEVWHHPGDAAMEGDAWCILQGIW